MLKLKDIISIRDLSGAEIDEILALAEKIKKDQGSYSETLKGKTLALIFQKPSNRTRVSFEVGMAQLGGHAAYLRPDELKLGERESVADVAKVLSRYIDGIVARTYSHKDIVDLAQSSTIPVINGLSDFCHPCQGLGDLFTVKEKFGGFSSKKIVFIGDGNNVLNSLMYGSCKMGLDIAVVTPEKYSPKKGIMEEVKVLAKESASKIEFYNKPDESLLKNADILYTDVWISMGQECDAAEKMEAFKGFQVNKKFMAMAKKGCKVMHCMPAHRGVEITDEVLDGPNSIMLDQAENRLHVQKAVLYLLLKRGKQT
jgi:ornithine carbamoyltransferase